MVSTSSILPTAAILRLLLPIIAVSWACLVTAAQAEAPRPNIIAFRVDDYDMPESSVYGFFAYLAGVFIFPPMRQILQFVLLTDTDSILKVHFAQNSC